MNKNLKFSVLLDFYGSLLSERQSDVMDLYYNEDLSLGEIADDIGITRQGVRDAIKKSEHILTDTEEKLGLASRFNEIADTVNEIKSKLAEAEFDGRAEIIEMIDKINI